MTWEPNLKTNCMINPHNKYPDDELSKNKFFCSNGQHSRPLLLLDMQQSDTILVQHLILNSLPLTKAK